MSYSVIPMKSKTRSWRVLELTYIKGQKNPKKSHVPYSDYARLGFDEYGSIEQARQRAKQLNAQQCLREKARQAIAERLKAEDLTIDT